MGAKSTIKRLPPELRQELDKLLADGRHTIREVTDHLRTLGAQVSKSAVGRYSQDFEAMAKRIRMAREMAAAMGRELGESDGETTRLLVESLQALVLQVQDRVAGETEIDTKDVADLCRSVKDLQSAWKGSRELQLRIQAETQQRIVKEVSEKGPAKGLSAEAISLFRELTMGVKQ